MNGYRRHGTKTTKTKIRKKKDSTYIEYYSVIRNKIIPFAATWMELETLILNEVRKRKTNTI